MKKIIFTCFIIIAIFITFTDCSLGRNDKTILVKAKAKVEVKSKLATSIINKSNQIIIKSAVIIKNKIIVIDPEHANKSNMDLEAIAPGSSKMKIKDGGGAQGIITNSPEYLINMRVALKLKSFLEASGYTVIMTKTSNSLSLGNIERANIGNNANANLVIRIHADSSGNGQVTGASVLVPMAINSNTKHIYEESKRCGTIVLDTLVKNVHMKNRGVVIHSDMTGFNWSKVPVILVEMGFLSNVTEDRLLSSEGYENEIAKGLATGIVSAEN